MYSWIVRCQDEEEGNSGWERVLAASKAKAARSLPRDLGGEKQAQLPGVLGLLRAYAVVSLLRGSSHQVRSGATQSVGGFLALYGVTSPLRPPESHGQWLGPGLGSAEGCSFCLWWCRKAGSEGEGLCVWKLILAAVWKMDGGGCA